MDNIFCTIENVVYVDFKHEKSKIKIDNGFATVDIYLKQCYEALTEDDFSDLIDAIEDPKFYAVCDPDIQDLADAYYSQLYKQ
jgi:hypothetical protein